MTLTDVQSTDPNAQGYREFSLGAFHFSRDEYFVHITWPTGKHVLSADVFLRALQRIARPNSITPRTSRRR